MQNPSMGSERTYSTREVADLFGVKAETVRRWSQIGLLARSPSTAKGHRYSVETVEKLLDDPGGDGN